MLRLPNPCPPPWATLVVAITVLLGLAGPAQAADVQTLLVQVEVPGALAGTTVHAKLDRLGQAHTLPLTDDGSTPGDIAGDGVHVGQIQGEYARALGLTLITTQNSVAQAVFAGVLRTDDAHLATLGFRLVATPEGTVTVRVPVPFPGGSEAVSGLLPLITAFGWGTLVMIYVTMLVFGRHPRRRPG